MICVFIITTGRFGAAFTNTEQHQKIADLIKEGCLTEFGSFAQDEGVRPELADGSIIEALITDGASEAAAAQDVKHVAAGPDGSNDAANRTTEEETDDRSMSVNTIQTLFISICREPEYFY